MTKYYVYINIFGGKYIKKQDFIQTLLKNIIFYLILCGLSLF